jgi:lysozyme
MKYLILIFIVLLLLISELSALGTSPVGIRLIQKYEGCRLKAYLCPARVPTIGIGHTGKDVRLGMTITRDQATILLRKDLQRFENYVERTITRPLPWYQNDAMVSFTFNTGSLKGNLKAAVQVNDTPRVIYWLNKYIYGGGKIQPGLKNRRRDEGLLYSDNYLT